MASESDSDALHIIGSAGSLCFQNSPSSPGAFPRYFETKDFGKFWGSCTLLEHLKISPASVEGILVQQLLPDRHLNAALTSGSTLQLPLEAEFIPVD